MPAFLRKAPAFGQWASFLAEDAIFWLLDINNEGTTNYKRANFGTVIGTLAGGDGDSGDDLGFFDTEKFITYSWDSDNVGNMGQEVATLLNDFKNAGSYEVTFDASGLTTGMYVYMINSGDFVSSKKMVLVK